MTRSTHWLILLIGLFVAVPPPAQAQTSPWLAAEESGGIAYFAFASPPRIERYDLGAAVWLSDISLPATPTAFAVDAQYLYVSFGRRTSRFALNGTGEFHLKNTPYDANILFVVGNVVVIHSGASYWSVNRTTGTQIDFEEDYWYPMRGVDVAPGLRKVFGRTAGVSPSDILVMTFNADGTFAELNDSPYHGDYANATRTFVFPGEARVADDSGIVYNTNDLTFSNSLGGPFQDLAFYGDLPIVLRDGEVIAYSNTFLETGRHEPAATPLDVAVHGEEVIAFHQAPGGLAAERFPIGLLEPTEPGEPVDPDSLAYEPDGVVLGRDDVVYLLSKAHLSIFRWSVPLRRYVETIPLAEAPGYMAYSAETHRLYLSYSPSAIRQIRLGESTLETPFANSPQTPCGLQTAGQYLFVCDPSGAWGTHYTYHPDGSLLDERDWNYYSREYTWSAANRRMYFFRDHFGPNDLHFEEIEADGTLGEAGESPFHGEVGTVPPIRVAPDGSVVVLGSGQIFDGRTLERRDALSNNIVDAAWIGGTLFTMRAFEGDAELQRWGQNYGLSAQRPLLGAPLRLIAHRASLLAITSLGGVPQFSSWDPALNEHGGAPPLNLGGGRFSVHAVWHTAGGAAGSGHSLQLTPDTGYFWFFGPANVEMIVKVLNACSYNGRFWVFAGGLTDVGVEIVVVDNATGAVRSYSNRQGQPFQPIQDTSAFAGCDASFAAAVPSWSSPEAASAPLLLNGRFTVEMDWELGGGQTGAGQPVPLTSDTGYFWFFDASNVEVVVKVLDGCAVNGHVWVFAGGLTDVATELRVTDTATGQTRAYTNPQGRRFQPLQDTRAFACP